LFGGGFVVPLGFVTVMRGGILVTVGRAVFRPKRSLFMCGGCPAVRAPRIDMALSGRLVSRAGPFQRLLGAQMRLLG
jgi:hypothetical protein